MKISMVQKMALAIALAQSTGVPMPSLPPVRKEKEKNPEKMAAAEEKRKRKAAKRLGLLGGTKHAIYIGGNPRLKNRGALIQDDVELGAGHVLAQFDVMHLKEAFNWHPFLKSEFKL